MPWRDEHRKTYIGRRGERKDLERHTDLMDREWEVLHPFIPPVKPGGRPRKTDMREVMNAILYKLVTGVQWDCVVYAGFPAKSTVQEIFLPMDENRGMGEDAARLGHA